MTGSVANNVVPMAKGAFAAIAKGHQARSKSDRPERGSTEPEVTVLFPQTKMANSARSKAQKSVIDSQPDSKKQEDPDNLTMGQDLFGSLVASVGQKLAQQEDSSDQQGDAQTVDISQDASMNRVSQLMRHGVLSDSLQNVTQKTVRETKKSSAPSNAEIHALASASDSQPTPETGFRDKENFVDLGEAKRTISVKSSIVAPPSQGEAGEGEPALANADALADPQAPAVENAAKSASVDKPALGNPKDTLPQRAVGQVTPALDATPATVVNTMDGKLLSPATQIVENIRNAVPPSAVVSQTGSIAPQTVKTLEIQLLPEGLGPVTVFLKSEQGKLKVQISAKIDTTRQELVRSSVELVSRLRGVDPAFTSVEVNFSNQNQGITPDASGLASGNGGERRGAYENMPGFGSNGGQDADQASPGRQDTVYEKSRPGQKLAAGEMPSRPSRADGIYL